MVAEALNALTAEFPACKTVVYADLSTNMVLVANDSAPAAREALDALCAEAALVLGTQGTPPLGNDTCCLVVSATTQSTNVYLRDSTEVNDAVCCICAPDVDLERFVPRARSCLDTILGTDV